jgi:TonB-dependent receptor
MLSRASDLFLLLRWLSAGGIVLALLPLARTAEPERRDFDLRAGPAAVTLKEFALQAGREIMFAAATVQDVNTSALRGFYPALEALDRLLAGTALFATEDGPSGALMVRQRNAPDRPPPPLPSRSDPTSPVNRKTLLSVLGLALGLTPAAPAAETSAATGATLIGRVSNESTGAYLPGATIRIESLGLATVSERDGSYRLVVPAGSHTLVASFSGLDARRQTLEFRAGATVTHDFALTAEVYRMTKYVVSSEREGNALALTLQRQADNVKNVISADAFGSLAGNPADLLQRVPGIVAEHVGGDIRYLSIRGINPDLSSIQIDGNRSASITPDRRAWFENLNADPIESMEVIKAPTPDMEADSIGGTINLKSRSGFDVKGRRISYSLGGTIAVRRDRPHPAATFSYADVLGRDQRLGISFSAGFREYVAVMDDTIHDFQNTETGPAYQWRLETVDRENLRGRWGGGLKLDYKLGDRASIFANFTYAPNSEDNFVITHRTATAQSVATLDPQGNPTGTGAILPGYTDTRTQARPLAASTVEIINLHRERSAAVYNVQLGGRFRDARYEIDYDATYSLGEHTDHFNRTTVTARGIGWILDRTGRSRWTPTVTYAGGPDPSNLDNYTTNVFDSVRPFVDNTLYGAQLNLRRNLDLPVPTYVKAGLRFRREENQRANRDRRWNHVGPDGTMGTADDRLSQFRDADYQYGHFRGFYAPRPIPDVDAMRDHIVTTPGLWREDTLYSLTQRLANDLYAEENVRAGYVMGHTRINRLSILAGLRVEDTQVEGEGPVVRLTAEERARRAAWVGPVTEAEGVRRILAERGGRQRQENDYRHVFPSLHFKFEARPGLIGRLSYSTGIGRPNFNTITPNLSVNDDNQIVTANNPGLRPQFSDNFDASLEYYFEPVGVISAGVFLKEISDFMFTAGGTVIGAGSDNGFDGLYSGYELRTQRNGGSARVRGFELNYQQQFTFLPGWLKGFGLLANYTWLETEGDYGNIGNTQTTAQVTGFTPSTGNVGVSYILGRYNLRVAYNYKDQKLTAFNALENRRRYEVASNRFDVKLRYLLTRNFDVYVDLYNAFNEKQREVWGKNRPRYVRDRNDPQIHVGVNGRF